MTEQEIFDAALRCYPNDKLGSVASFINGAMFVKNSMDASSGKSEVSDSYSPNCVSFDMANRLKEAEFPQRAVTFGQFWYLDEALYIALPDYRDSEDIVFKSLVNGSTARIIGSMVFAPTAQDIQKEFQKRFGGSLEISYNEETDLWTADETTETLISGYGGRIVWRTGENVADCAARCFLSNPRKRGSCGS